MPAQVAATARASGCGNPGASASPVVTSSRPTRDRIATPFHAVSPWAANSYPRAARSAPSSSASASSASFVSWRQTTSGRRSSSHGTSRGMRCLMELTFQVAMRTGYTVPEPGRAPGGSGGQPVGQAEAGKALAADEGGHLDDAVTAQGQDVDHSRLEVAPLGVPEVAGDGQ